MRYGNEPGQLTFAPFDLQGGIRILEISGCKVHINPSISKVCIDRVTDTG